MGLRQGATCLAFGLVLASCGGGDPANPVPVERASYLTPYEHPEGRFSIGVPGEWRINDAQMEYIEFGGIPGGDDWAAVGFLPMPPGQTAAGYLEQIEEVITRGERAMGAVPEFGDPESVSHDGIEWLRQHFHTVGPDYEINYLHWLAEGANSAGEPILISVQCSSPHPDWEERRKVCMDVFRSLDIHSL